MATRHVGALRPTKLLRSLLSWAALGLPALAHANFDVAASYLAIDVGAPSAAGGVWYGLQQPGPRYLVALDGASLGSFVAGTHAFIDDAELDSQLGGSSDVTNASVSWQVDGGSLLSAAIGLAASGSFTDAAGNVHHNVQGLQQWSGLLRGPVDFLAGLSPGTHTMRVYTTVFGDQGGAFNSAMSEVGFTVTSPVPEPASGDSMLAGLGLLLALARFTRRRPAAPIGCGSAAAVRMHRISRRARPPLGGPA